MPKSALFAGCAIAVILASSAWNADTAIPDLSGTWAREFIGFEPPASGRGPIANTSRMPRVKPTSTSLLETTPIQS